ncbi:hypothetical protein [Devosia naphthalenivorans]|uniref:hypothetical protein n=1 Tax=Devosia naphthalenivorans TaxID=2082392 RepID=UPI0013B052C4|nr:hypothetical protein [Devosia naphthalenivorans]
MTRETVSNAINIAATWLAANWESAVAGAPLTKQLREQYGLSFADAVRAIAEAKRRLGK